MVCNEVKIVVQHVKLVKLRRRTISHGYFLGLVQQQQQQQQVPMLVFRIYGVDIVTSLPNIELLSRTFYVTQNMLCVRNAE